MVRQNAISALLFGVVEALVTLTGSQARTLKSLTERIDALEAAQKGKSDA